MKYFFIGLLLIISSIAIYFFMINNKDQGQVANTQNAKIRYVPIGDSFTAGTGVLENQTYPVLLTEHLRREGIDIVLVTNPAMSGYTTQDAIRYELPELAQSNANFVTVLIGANDILSKSPQEFSKEYIALLDGIGKEVPESIIVLLTIPDFSFTPHAQSFGYSEEQIRESILAFNLKIKEEAEKRDLQIVDLYAITTRTGYDKELFVADEFHPSARQYILWEKQLFLIVYDKVK